MKVAIYARTSTVKQEYDRQIDTLKKYCQNFGYDIVGLYEEKLSGKIDDRPEFKKLCALTKNDVDMVVVWEFSRLGRNAIVTQSVIKDFTEKGIDVFIYNQDLHTLKDGKENPYTKMLIAIMSTWAESESEYIKERMVSGRDYAIENKGGNIRRIPYGFKSIDKKLVIYEEEAKVVREIFDMSIAGMSYYSIAVNLNSRGIPRPIKNHGPKGLTGDGKWRSSSVMLVLKNPIYMGVFSHHKWEGQGKDLHITEKKWQCREDIAIIPKETFLKCQESLHERNSARSKSAIHHDYLLRGLIVCPCCGNIMSRGRSGKLIAYKCSQFRNKMGTKRCTTSPQINQTKLDVICWEAVKNYCMKKFNQDSKAESIDSLKKEICSIERLITSIELQINKLNIEAATYLDVAVDMRNKYPTMTDLYDKEMNKIAGISKEIERLSLEKQIYEKQLEEKKDTISRIESAGTYIDNKGIDKIKYFRSVVKQVRPYGNGWFTVILIELINRTIIHCGYYANRPYYIVFYGNNTDGIINGKFYPKCYFDEEKRLGYIGEKTYDDYHQFLDDAIKYNKKFYDKDIIHKYKASIESTEAVIID